MVRWLAAPGLAAVVWLVVCPATASNYEYVIPRGCITKVELSKDTYCHRKPEEKFFHCDNLALTYRGERCENVVSIYSQRK
jgi:hypothetical protein